MPSNRYSLKFKWFFSYLLVSVIPLIVSIAIFLTYNTYLTKSNNELNHITQDSIASNVQDILLSVRQISTEITTSAYLDKVLLINNHSDYFRAQESRALIQTIKNMRNFFPKASQIYLYIEKSDMVLSSRGVLESQRYYSAFMTDSTLTYEQWKNTISTQPTPESYSVYENGEEKSVLYMFKMHRNSGTVTLAIETPESNYFCVSDNLPWTTMSDLYIFNSSGQLILYNMRSHNPIDLPKNYSDIKKLPDEFGVLCSSISYDSTNWQLVSVIPENMHIKILNILEKFSISLLFLSNLFFIFLLYRRTAKNYKPLSEIVHSFGKNSLGSEYRIINDSIKELISMNEQYSSEITQQRNQLKNLIFSRLLSGNLDSNADYLLQHYNINIPYETFTVLLLNSSLWNENPEFSERCIEIINKVPYRNITINSCEISENTVVILNYDKLSINISELIKQHFTEINELCDTYSIDMCIAVSNEHHGYIGITKCYFEALDTLSRHEISGSTNCNLAFFNELPEYTTEFLSMQQENSFLTNAKNHDMEKCRDDLEKIFLELESISSLSNRSIYMYDIACMILKLSRIIDINSNKELAEKINFHNLISSAKNQEDFKTSVFEIFNEIQTYDLNCNNTSGNIRAENILNFIHKNYKDINLSINLISNHIGLSTKYLNVLFQNAYKVTVHSYINKYRIEKAAVLIKEGAKIKNVYTAVGFTNARTFNRIFKQYYNMSPVEYRSLVGN